MFKAKYILNTRKLPHSYLSMIQVCFVIFLTAKILNPGDNVPVFFFFFSNFLLPNEESDS